jgi:transcriptional repressor NrdR
MPLVVKKDGRREPYLREKVLDGIKKACQKRSVNTLKIEELVNHIEKTVQSYGLKEVPARTIGHMVMVELHKLDKVAYVRFASVYREFRDVEEFVAELQGPVIRPEDSNHFSFSFSEPAMTPEAGNPGSTKA